MRTLDERTAAVKQRAAALRRRQRLRRDRLLGVSLGAGSLALIVGLSLAMPGLLSGASGSAYGGGEGLASIFTDGAALGYIFTGVLAFALGVCLTVFCYRLRRLRQEEEAEDNGRAD